MPNLTQPPDNPAKPPPGPTPYFIRAALEAEAALRGLPPEPWPAWPA